MADVGILYSPDNHLGLLAPAGPPDASRQPHSFGHWGFATAMIDAHVPYRAVVDWKLQSQSLAGLRTFVIPDAQWLDDQVLGVLEDWVRAGGRLVITGTSGTRQGTGGIFARRTTSLLAPLAGVDNLESNGSSGVHRRNVGAGLVIWTPESVGMEYYVRHDERASLLGQVTELVGESSMVDARHLPATVGLFGWKSDDGRAVFWDLVNYDWNADTDRVTSASDLCFRVRRPEGIGGVDAVTLSPDSLPPAAVELQDDWLDIRLPQLLHFASVKITLK
jgi:hypothetical protein